MRGLIAAVCLIAVAILPACSRDKPPNSLFNAAGYHVRGDKVYYLAAFPGQGVRDRRGRSRHLRGFRHDLCARPLPGVLRRPPGRRRRRGEFRVAGPPRIFQGRQHVYQLDRPISDDPAHFELLDGDVSKDSTAVYWSDGSVLSDDPAHFAIVSNRDHYLFTKDSRTVHVNGNPIAGADPTTFRVLQGAYSQDGQRVFYFADEIVDADAASFRPLDGPYASDSARVYWMGKTIDGADPNAFRVLNSDFECSADEKRAYYRDSVVAGADPASFPAGRAVTRCDETSVSFAE